MRQFAVSAIGRDRPGLVAGLTRTLLAHRVNIEDSQMSILRGHFSMMLLISAPDALDPAALSSDLAATGDELGLEALSMSEISIEEAGRRLPAMSSPSMAPTTPGSSTRSRRRSPSSASTSST